MSRWIKVRTIRPAADRNKNYGVGTGQIAYSRWTKIRGKSAGKGGPPHKRRGGGR